MNDDKRTVASAHNRIDGLEMGVLELRTEQRIQFKDLYNRVKRTEQILWAAAGSIIGLLIAVLMKVG